MTDPAQQMKAVPISGNSQGGPQRGHALLQVLSGFDASVVAALEQHQAEKLPIQERESL